MTVIEIRPHRWGWKAFESRGVEPVFLSYERGRSLLSTLGVVLCEGSVMPRPLRIEYAGVRYHVISRGDRRGAIFHDDADRQEFLRTLGQIFGHRFVSNRV